MYDDVSSVPGNILEYVPGLSRIVCINRHQPGCITDEKGGISTSSGLPCCLDYQARFCCEH